MNRAFFVLFCLVFRAAALFAQASYSSPETGEKVLGSYFSTDVDDVSMTNGNLHVRIPLFTLPGRELPLTVSMDYNSQFYEKRMIYPPTGEDYYYEYLAWRKNAGIGGTLRGSNTWVSGTGYWQSTGHYIRSFNLTITWIRPDGTKHDFKKTVDWDFANDTTYTPPATIYDNRTIDSTESDFMQLVTGNYLSGQGNPAPAIIYFKNGNAFDFTNRELRTPNGNRLTAASTATETLVPVNGGASTIGLADYLPLSDTVGRLSITHKFGRLKAEDDVGES